MTTACNPGAYNVVNSFTPDINISYLSLPSELVCPDYYSDVYRYTPDAEKGQRWVLYDDCNMSEYCDTEDPSCKPIPTDLDYSLSVEDADPQVRVFKQPGDYVTAVFHSDQTQTVEYSTIGLVSESETCADGQADLSAGETRCKFSIPEDATSAILTTGNKTANIHLTTNPDTIYVTDRNALKQRYEGDPNGVQQVLTQLYSKADERQAPVYYLDDYLTGRPWGDFNNEYNEDPNNPNVSTNVYAMLAASFTTEKCGGCKNTVLIGDDFVVPQYRRPVTLSSNSYPFNILPRTESKTGIYSDFPYISTVSIPFSRISDTFEGELRVVIVLPRQNQTTEDILYSATLLNEELKLKYGGSNGYLVNGAQIRYSDDLTCASRDELKRATLILIGNEGNNNAIACLPWTKEADTISITRNTWSDELNYAYVINSEDSEIVDVFTQIINQSLLSNSQISLISVIKFTNSNIKLPYADTNMNFSDIPGVCGHISDKYSEKNTDFSVGAWCIMNNTRNVIVMMPIAPGVPYGNMPLKQETSEFVVGTMAGASGEDYYEGSLPYLAGNILGSFWSWRSAMDLRHDYFDKRDYGRSILDAVGVIPAISVLKKYESVSKFLKNGGKIEDAAKMLRDLSNEEFLAESTSRAMLSAELSEATKLELLKKVFYKDADALRDTLKAKGLSDAEVDQAFLKYVNAGYNLKDVKVAMEAKYAIESMSDVEKIAYLQEHFSSSVSHLKNDYGLADADILKLSDQGVPLSSLYGKLTRIAEDEGFGKRFALMTADGIKKGVIKADTISPITLAEYVKNVKSISNFPANKAPWDILPGSFAKQQTLKLMRTGDPTTKTIVMDGNTLVGEFEETAVLKKGIHYGPNNGFGWEHIKAEGHNTQIKDTFGLADDDEAVKDFVAEGLEKGAKDPNDVRILWDVPENTHKLIVVLSEDSLGSITTIRAELK